MVLGEVPRECCYRMKSNSPMTVSPVGRLQDWIQAPTPPCTLVLGAACSCDLPEIEQLVCKLLSRVRELHGLRFTWLDHQDIRFLSGQPGVRRAILDRAGIGGDRYHRWNDTELVLRGLASMGGLVLGGQAALDATHDLPNVCRLMLCDCRICRETELDGTVDPARYHSDEQPTEVIRRFLDWMAGNPYGLASSSPAASEICRMKETLEAPSMQIA